MAIIIFKNELEKEDNLKIDNKIIPICFKIDLTLSVFIYQRGPGKIFTAEIISLHCKDNSYVLIINYYRLCFVDLRGL